MGDAHFTGSGSPISELHGHALIPPQNPATNVAPTSAMYENCAAQSPTSNQIASCDQETVSAIDAARSERRCRADDPAGRLRPDARERTDPRGLEPGAHRPRARAQWRGSHRRSTRWLKGAHDDTDPPFPNPFYGTGGGSNWASTSSVLFADFLFMYDDGPGPGGINLDCTTTDTLGLLGPPRQHPGQLRPTTPDGCGDGLGHVTHRGVHRRRQRRQARRHRLEFARDTLPRRSFDLNGDTESPGRVRPKSPTVTVWDSGVEHGRHRRPHTCQFRVVARPPIAATCIPGLRVP